MWPEEAGKIIERNIQVTRDDIARAKPWILQMKNGNVDANVGEWLKTQGLAEPKTLNIEAPDVEEVLRNAARAISLCHAFHVAILELSSSGDIVIIGDVRKWNASIGYRTPRGAGPIDISVTYLAPTNIARPVRIDALSTDPDIFLDGVDCSQLHSGIQEAISQSLTCFQKGLYMPATVMLAAAAEATWTECGLAVAKNLNDSKLDNLFGDQYASINKKVLVLRQTLENAKTVLKTAGQNIGKVYDAEIWTTVLRDRRNALHWKKAQSFVANHSETATLLMAAPLHISTLEAIRHSC